MSIGSSNLVVWAEPDPSSSIQEAAFSAFCITNQKKIKNDIFLLRMFEKLTWECPGLCMSGSLTDSLLVLVMFVKGFTLPVFLSLPLSESDGRFKFKFLSFSLSRSCNDGPRSSCTKEWLFSKLVLDGISGSKPSHSSL